MKRISLLCGSALLAVIGFTNSGFAAENNEKWLIRVRSIYVAPSESSNVSIGGKANVDNKVVPEVDVSYFFTSNIALELIAATSKHNVKLNHGTNLGDVWLLPPTLMLQYHFTDVKYVKPYVGAGVNYTHFYNSNAGDLNSVHYKDSLGGALQAGVDVPIKNNWYFNFDVKKIWINSDVKFNDGAVRASVDINPWVVGTGIGYRF